MFDLSGKRVLVTGASGGIGGAVARALHGAGAITGLTGRNRLSLDALAGELGNRAFVFEADLAEPDVPSRLISEAGGTMGGVDILVNNAGFARDGLFVRMKDEDWSAVIEVNLTATFRLSRAVLRGMLRSRWGRIINISSIVGTMGNAGQANYAASKAGLVGLSKSLAAEVGARGITVNCVAPGFILTAMTESMSEDQQGQMIEQIPSGRLGTPEDVAACVLFLATEEASYVTGQTLHVNGGMTMI